MLEARLTRDLAALAPEWDELADRTRAMPFVRPGWFEAWWSAFGAGELELLTVRREGRLCGVLPLARKGGSVRSPANWESPDFAFLADGPEPRRELARELLAHAGRSASIQFLAAEGDDLRECRAAAAERRFRTVERTVERSPYLVLEGDFETYFRSRGKNLVDSVRRRRRRLAEEGTVEFEVDDGRERLEQLLREGYALEGSGWKQETAIDARDDARRFYDSLTAWAAARGILRLAFLRLAGRPVAFQLALEEHGVFYYYKAGYDPAYQRFSPGKLLIASLLERAFEQGLERVELLGADEPWKLEWMDAVHERRLFQAYAPSATGLAAWAAEAWGRPAARHLRVRRALDLVRR